MNTPRRIQLRRTKGWRLPEGAVVVARPTKWGNPYKAGMEYYGVVPNQSEVVEAFRRIVDDDRAMQHDARRELRGRDLGCWCRLCAQHADGLPLGARCEECEPCHADVLLEVANR